MGNEDRLSGSTPIDFFADPDAIKFFAKLDYGLKDGVHYQDIEEQRLPFQFLRKHERSLRLFYALYYEVRLEQGGESQDRYYFLDFQSGSRGKIDQDHREFLKPEHVIVGFLIYKIIFIDGNVELTSVRKLQCTIKQDYEELKPNLYRLLAKLKRTNSTTWGDAKIDEIVLEALKDFKRLGWIQLEDDFFDVLASFQRINKLYADYINQVDEWLAKY